jgi:uncharacterized membrane protein (UPF0136 family)
MSFFLTMLGMFLAASLAGIAVPLTIAAFSDRTKLREIATLLTALALVGACAGLAGGMSRTAAVGSIIPGFLGLLGGVAVYLFGADQSKGLIASYGAATLSIALLIGFMAGSRYRLAPEDHREIRTICAKAFTDGELLGNDKAFGRFQNQMGAQCERAMHWWITGAKSVKEAEQ